MNTKQIDTLQNLSAKDFFDTYLGKKPFVLLNKISHWPAYQNWTPNYLKLHYGDATIPVVLYDSEASSTFLDQTAVDAHKTMLLRDYLDSFYSNDKRYAIREDATLFQRFPEMLKEMDYFSPFCSNSSALDDRYKTLWIGPANYVTGLHTDPGDTLLFQIYGRKQVILFAPDQSVFLYEESHEQIQRKLTQGELKSRIDYSELAVLKDKVKWCKVNFFNLDIDKFPLFQQAKCIEAVIDPGSVLYIPDQWWHTVRALDHTISVSIDPSFDGAFFDRMPASQKKSEKRIKK